MKNTHWVSCADAMLAGDIEIVSILLKLLGIDNIFN